MFLFPVMLSTMTMNKLIYENLSPEVATLLKQLRQQLMVDANEVWLVGGTIRDLLEGQRPKDFDFAFNGDLTPQVRRWAKLHDGHWFWLDKSRNQSRVVFSFSGLQFDFSPLRAENIDTDLKLRDFTLNAMALLFNSVDAENLLDPLNGRQDLRDGVLRCCGSSVLRDDPLRVLKGVRHHALRGWKFEVQTSTLIIAAAPQLHSVAGERIRNELGQILRAPQLVSAINMMKIFGILDNLFPQIDSQRLRPELAAFVERIEQLRQIDHFARFLDQSIEDGLTRKAILILAVLLRRVGPLSQVGDIVQRLRLSVRSRSILKDLCGGQASLDVFTDCDNPRISALKLELFGRNCLELTLFALAYFKTDSLDLRLSNYFTHYHHQSEGGRISDLLDGREISSLTGLPPGERVGDYLQRIKAAEIAGEILDKTMAVVWLKRQFSD